MLIKYCPSEYSPQYELEVDDAYEFIRLVAVRTHEYPDAEELPLEPHYVEYAPRMWRESRYRKVLRTNHGLPPD
jgi:hypothetical protein